MTRTCAALLLASALLGSAPAAARAADAGLLGAAQPHSLLGAESLGGGSAALAWAGFASLGATYGQGLSAQDDLLASVEFDWSSTELWLSGAWRRPVGSTGGWDLALRLQAGWYLDFGGTWIHDDNLGDRGLLLAPALILSSHAGDGLISLTAGVPVTFTTWRDGGFLVAPKVSVGYETLAYGDLSLGVRAALGWRGGGGDAPMRAGRFEPELLVLVGYRIF